MPIAISIAWRTITPASRTRSSRVEDQIEDGFGQAAAGKLRQSVTIPGC
jgi:hypothetical protein